MKRLFLLTPVILLSMAVAAYAVGTPAGTQFSNLSVQASYTSAGGAQYSNSATGGMPKVTVRTGYDLSLIPAGPAKQSGSAGQWLTFDFGSITNYGNMSTELCVAVVTNKNSEYTGSGWYSIPFEIFTNGTLAASGNDVLIYKQAISAGGYCDVSVRARILPGVTPDGSTNTIEIVFADCTNYLYAGAGSGDGWPTAYASYWGIQPDAGNVRDNQGFSKILAIQGPVLLISKTANTNYQLPFGPVTYTIKYTNSGSGLAMGVRIDDVIPQNVVALFSNSAENNNTYHAGSSTVEYWAASAWQTAAYDDVFAQSTNISRVRWTLDTAVASGQVGFLRFSVIIK